MDRELRLTERFMNEADMLRVYIICATFSARYPICATFQYRDIPFARLFRCATFQLRDIPFARLFNCATSHLRDFFLHFLKA